MSKRTLIVILTAFFLGAAAAFFSLSHTQVTSALATDGFRPGNIISDAVMANYNSMSVADIQAFLTAKNPCHNTDYADYLRATAEYPNISWHWSGEPYNGHFVCLSEERFGDGTELGSGQTAAEIIYAAAQASRINPQVLLVLLEKEQSLITDDAPHSNQYRSATGYGCPDTAACDSKYYGFKNQVFRAAELFRYTLDYGYYAYPENTAGVYVAYNPNGACGKSEVLIENRATAALYRYTPYQPNASALAAGWGQGNSCSAYGNRNFYLYFTKWFGSTQVAGLPAVTISIPTAVSSLSFQYSSHVQDIGWQAPAQAGQPIGSVGRSLRLEAFKIDSPDISYQSYIAGNGWESTWHTNNEVSGTTNQSKCLNAIRIKLSDRLASGYDIYYRVHVSDIGWMGWAKNGESAGTNLSTARIEAIQVTIVSKGSAAPSGSGAAYQEIQASVTIPVIDDVLYHSHSQDLGWQSWVKNGAIAGTTGKALRLEAIEIKLTGEAAQYYDIEYRAHVQDLGWQSWVKNGAIAGTTGKALRLEAIEVRIVKK